MLRTGLAILTAAASWSAHAATLPPPIARASQGQMECNEPDVSRKVCQSMVSYSLHDDGLITGASTSRLITSPAVTMSAVSVVTIKAGEVCGYVTPQVVAQATFTIDGTPATPEQNARLRDRLQIRDQPLYGSEICTAYETDADGTVTKVTIGGVTKPQASQRVIWVSASDGYKVEP